MPKMKISESTTIPLSVLGTLGVAGVGIVMWLTTIFVQGNANANEIKELKAEIKIIYEINARVIRIEDKLEQMHKK